MKNKFTDLIEKIKYLIYNYPLVLLMSLATAIVIITGIELDRKYDFDFVLLKLGFTFALGISSQFALKMLSQRIKNGFAWQIIGLLFLVIFYFIFPEDEKDFNELYAFILIPTFILSHLLVAFIAFTKKENTENNFWQYNKNLFVNIFMTAIFTGVLVGGVELAILAIENLFNLKFDYKIYGETFFGLAVFGSTIIFLLFNETGLNTLEKEGNYPVVLKFFTQYILIPLLIIYVIILYFYALKIVIHWELPRGWVSYLVLAYSIVGILALLLVHPLKQLKVKSWIIIFNKIFYYTLIPLIVLLFTAIFTRVLEYGYTEPRYFVLLISLWLTSVVVYFVFFKKTSIKFIPISLFLFGLFALLFPYFNAFSVSKRSQQNELTQVLTQSKLLVNGKIDFNKTVVDSVKYEIEDKLEYLSKRKDSIYLMQFLNDDAKKEMSKNKYWYNSLFKNVTYIDDGMKDSFISIHSTQKLHDIKGYDYVLFSEYHLNEKTKINNDIINITKSYNFNKNPEFKISVNNETKDLLPMVKSICEKHKNTSENAIVEDLSFTVDLEKYQIKVVFESIDWDKKDNIYNFRNVMYLIKEIK